MKITLKVEKEIEIDLDSKDEEDTREMISEKIQGEDGERKFESFEFAEIHDAIKEILADDIDLFDMELDETDFTISAAEEA